MTVLLSGGVQVVARCAAGALVMLPLPALAEVPPLNDTGMITCYNASQATGNTEPPGFEGQDCSRGAAAAEMAGVLYKIGGSSTRGRDYTKIANDGSELPASATRGPGPGDWGCTRDNVTGLTWELKTSDAGLRHVDHSYRWYNPDPNHNGGQPGSTGGATCGGTLPDNACNTLAYQQAVNSLVGAARLCGANDWRLPDTAELYSLVDFQRSSFPSIDQAWFPGTPADYVWSRETHPAALADARVLDFRAGVGSGLMKTQALRILLVRGVP